MNCTGSRWQSRRFRGSFRVRRNAPLPQATGTVSTIEPPKLSAPKALDTAPGKTVPEKFRCTPAKCAHEKCLLEQSYQFNLLGQKGVVAVIAGHVAIVGGDTCGAD